MKYFTVTIDHRRNLNEKSTPLRRGKGGVTIDQEEFEHHLRSNRFRNCAGLLSTIGGILEHYELGIFRLKSYVTIDHRGI